jgi:hypothetical protein
LRAFLKGSQIAGFRLDGSLNQNYAFIDSTVDRLDYRRLSRKDKRAVLAFLKKITGYRRSQLFSLVNRAAGGSSYWPDPAAGKLRQTGPYQN